MIFTFQQVAYAIDHGTGRTSLHQSMGVPFGCRSTPLHKKGIFTLDMIADTDLSDRHIRQRIDKHGWRGTLRMVFVDNTLMCQICIE